MAFFKSSKIEDDKTSGFQPIPKGTYKCSIFNQKVFSSPEKLTLQLGFSVADFDSPIAKRKVWYNFNLRHKSKASQEVSEKMLNQLMFAIGREGEEIQCPSELEFKMLKVFIVVNGDSNSIGKFMPIANAETDNESNEHEDSNESIINVMDEPIGQNQSLSPEELSAVIDEALGVFDDTTEENVLIIESKKKKDFDNDIPF